MASIGSNCNVQGADLAASRADIVVALTTYNDVRTVGAVVRALNDGLSRYFASQVARFVLADTGSTDGTREAAREVVEPAALVEIACDKEATFGELPYHGHPARAAAVRAILQTAQRLNAKACAVVDASLHAVEPELVERLVTPVLTDGFDYVSPYFVRHVNEGALTRSVVYPLFRALYGARLRQPAAIEFACSERLVTHYLEQDFWDIEQASVGVDLWLASAAATAQFRLCETTLGARLAASRVRSDVSTTVAQVVGAMFADMEYRVDFWQRVRGSAAIPVFGAAPAFIPEAPPLNVDGLIESFRLGYRELREIWTWVLPARTIVELRKLTESAADRFEFDDRLWASVVYDFALGYALRVMPHDHLLRSLTPLYTGWLASFVLQMKSASVAQIEERVEQLCVAFELEKRHLISRWRWPERLR